MTYHDDMARGSGIKEHTDLSPEAVLYGRLLPGSPKASAQPDDSATAARLGQNQLRVLKTLSSYGSVLDIDIHQLVESSGSRALSHIGGVMTVLNSLKKYDLVEADGREWWITELGKRALASHSV